MTYADFDLIRLSRSDPVAGPDAAEAVRTAFGLTGELTRLPGEADDNFLLCSAVGARYVVKVAHARADPAVVAVQARVLRYLERTAPGLPVPRLVPGSDGQPWQVIAAGPLRGRLVHVVTYLDGQPLRAAVAAAGLRRRLGATLAVLGRALREFDDGPPPTRPLLWDLAQLPLLQPLLAELPPAPATRLLDEQLGRLCADVLPLLAAQRRQLVHNDLNPDNVLIRPQQPRQEISGIIDFGDLTVTALVNDVAIAAAYQLAADGDPLGPALELIAGYHAEVALTPAELTLLPDLILARVLARIVISEWRAVRFPENVEYIMRHTPIARAQFDRLRALPADETAARLRQACPQEASPQEASSA